VIIPVDVGVLGFVFVAYLSARVLAKEPGNARIQELSGYIYEGAMAFLARKALAGLFF
jgi:K(+)-stimulated pyrophosphate-energized sodium pump